MDKEMVANLKTLALDMINTAGSGHPGIVLGAAPIIYTVYAKHMNISTNDPNWINRDRFVMSAGHGSALLYATLYMAGYDLTCDDLKKFRTIGSKTPGHPEYGVTPGVDVSTGPLGQGFANAVGMALGGKIYGDKFTFSKGGKFDKEKSLIDYRVYVLCGDGDLMEGISTEAASLAGTLNLDNLIVLYDSNSVSLDGDTSNTFTENVCDKFKAMGWYTDLVKDGNNINDIDKAIDKAKKSGKPSLIEVRTVIGNGSINAGTSKVHGSPLSEDDILQIKISLNIPVNQPFFIDESARNLFRQEISERSGRKYEIWSRNYSEYVTKVLDGDQRPLDFMFKKHLYIDLGKISWDFDPGMRKSLRDINSNVMNVFASYFPNFIGGSADLASSTKTYLKKYQDVKDGKYNGRNIWFGVREHSMGAILNGLSLVNFKVFGSTFLTFADYIKPAMRMTALMNLPVTYIFTHDSINIGPDGPTHQPVEQLAMMRAMPNFDVYRPADAKEVVGCWNQILRRNKPCALVLSRNEVPLYSKTDVYKVEKGGYIIKENQGPLNGIIIATGSEVGTAINIANDLAKERGLNIRVVSMPSLDLYKNQPIEYKKALFPVGIKTFVIEAGSKMGWESFVYNDNYIISIDEFGVSGSSSQVSEKMEFSYDQIKQRILKLL